MGIYSSMAETFEYSIYTCTSQEVFASGLDKPSGIHVDARHVYVGEYGTSRIVIFNKTSGARVSHVETGAQGLLGITLDSQGQLWFVDGPGNTVNKVVVSTACSSSSTDGSNPSWWSQVTWAPTTCSVQPVWDTDADREVWHQEAFLNTNDESNFPANYPSNYATMTKEQCDLVNFDILLMEGFICHVCLPEPCKNGGSCVHYDGIYTSGGFSCQCNETSYHGDMCQLAGEATSTDSTDSGSGVPVQPGSPVQLTEPEPGSETEPEPEIEPKPEPEPELRQLAEVMAAIEIPGAIVPAHFKDELLAQLPVGASVVITKFEQKAQASANLPGSATDFESTAAQAQLKTGLANAAGVSINAVAITSITDSRRRRLATGVAINYAVTTTDPASATAVVDAMTSETFSATFVSTVNSAGTAIGPLSASDVVVTEPEFITSMDFTVSVAADNTASATALQDSIVSTTSDSNGMAALADTAKVAGTSTISTVTAVATVQPRQPLLSSERSGVDASGTSVVDEEEPIPATVTFALAVAVGVLVMACGTVSICRGRKSLAKDKPLKNLDDGHNKLYAADQGYQTRKRTPPATPPDTLEAAHKTTPTNSMGQRDSTNSKARVAGRTVLTTLHHKRKQWVVSVRRGKHGFGMVVGENCPLTPSIRVARQTKLESLV